MNTLERRVIILALAALAPAGATLAQQHGMPPEARAAIHVLLDQHDAIERTVTPTETGYVAVTESDDPELAAVLRDHVAQMAARLEEGLMVRRWDPAFAEYVRYYDRMTHEITATERGVRMVVNATTPEAIAVARNHAAVIVDFVEHGWDGHDRLHPAVTGGADEARGRGRNARAGGHGRGGCCGGCGAGS